MGSWVPFAEWSRVNFHRFMKIPWKYRGGSSQNTEGDVQHIGRFASGMSPAAVVSGGRRGRRMANDLLNDA
jgi:hypothetical protein